MAGIKNEMLVFLCACLTGITVRAGYQIPCLFRKLIAHHPLAEGIEDLIYWIGMSAYIFSKMYATTYGSIRWYFLLGLVAGAIFMQKLIADAEKIYKKTKKKLEIIRENR